MISKVLHRDYQLAKMFRNLVLWIIGILLGIFPFFAGLGRYFLHINDENQLALYYKDYASRFISNGPLTWLGFSVLAMALIVMGFHGIKPLRKRRLHDLVKYVRSLFLIGSIIFVVGLMSLYIETIRIPFPIILHRYFLSPFLFLISLIISAIVTFRVSNQIT